MPPSTNNPGRGVHLRAYNAVSPDTNSVTGNSAVGISSFNIVRNNSMFGVIEEVLDKRAIGHTSFASWPFIGRNNAYIGNTMSDGVKMVGSRSYVSGSPVLQQPCGLLSSDPTGHVSNWYRDHWGEWDSQTPPSSLNPPQGVQVEILY